MERPVHFFLLMLGIVLFFIGAVAWWGGPPNDSWRWRAMSAGLFCWALSTIVTI